MASTNPVAMKLVSDFSSNPAISSLCEREGFTVEALTVVQFNDDLEDMRWFNLDFVILGYIAAVCDGGQPIDATEILAQIRREFGSNVSVLW